MATFATFVKKCEKAGYKPVVVRKFGNYWNGKPFVCLEASVITEHAKATWSVNVEADEDPMKQEPSTVYVSRLRDEIDYASDYFPGIFCDTAKELVHWLGWYATV